MAIGGTSQIDSLYLLPPKITISSGANRIERAVIPPTTTKSHLVLPCIPQ